MKTNLHHLKSPLIINPHPFFSPQKPSQFLPFKRRRLKPCKSNLLEPFQNFLSQLPSPNTVDIFAPALGLASGLTLYLSQSKKSNESSNVGEWILFSSPTPFNRFLILRCPSISLQGSEFLGNLNDKLVKEDRHFVRLNSGRIRPRGGSSGVFLVEKLEYQRVCVNTEDGGVISLDWPANLELEEEHGLDATLLLVPGTARGSMEENVRFFVVDALKRGFFPVVMNPRGCAGSPITTARLFTAADSDDISTAIQFISKARPWTTLMGVGWGFGANMLTKYLAEVGESTPLTAATCINNPFDLVEATRCSPYHAALDRKLTGGLIEILQSNREMFRGRTKGFDLEKALSSKSIRDFEEAISMVSYGFEEIEDFYSKSSTRGMIGSVKIPVLFIQSDDGTVPLFSVPRSLIAENPFTSLLLCSCAPSSVVESGRAAVYWCQNLTIEWLTAVELGLLKGRHPLLKDVDVNINPSKGLTIVEGRSSDKGVLLNKHIGLNQTDGSSYTIEPIKQVLEDSNTAVRLQSRSRENPYGDLKLKERLQGEQQTNSVDAELVAQESADPGDSEKGQILQTAQVVMNMLDVTIPGTLSEYEKKKVLTAVDQGETLMKALEDAVPEEVRGKLTFAVSGILHSQHTNLKIDALLGISNITNVPKIKNPENVKEVSSAEGVLNDPHPLDQMKRAEDSTDGSANIQPGAEKSPESELHTSKNVKKSTDTSQPKASNHQGEPSGSVKNDSNELVNKNESDEFKEKGGSYADNREKRLETSSNTSHTEKPGGTEEAMLDGGTPQLETKSDGRTQKNEEKTADSSADQNRMVSANIPSSAGSSPDSQSVESEGNDEQKRENKTMEPALEQNKPALSDQSHPTFGVAQALDALTGMDDSTQVAVNSVFGVIENMISQLEEEQENENNIKAKNEVKDELVDSKPKKMESTNDIGMQSDRLQHPHVHELHENNDNLQDAASTGCVGEEPTEDPILFSGDGTNGPQRNTSSNYEIKEEQKMDQSVSADLLVNHADRLVKSTPLHFTVNPYGDFLQDEYLHRYLLSKIQKTKPLDLDTTTALLLDYFPEEGQWKLLDQPGTTGESTGAIPINKGADPEDQVHSSVEVDGVNYIEPLYVVLDTEKQQEPVEEYSTVENFSETGDGRVEELMKFVKMVVLDALRVEISRKIGAVRRKEMKSILARELEQVADSVSFAVGYNKDNMWCLKSKHYTIDDTGKKVGFVHVEHVVKAVSSAVLRTSYLRRLVPVGVIIGSSLAALRKYFDVAARNDDVKSTDETEKNVLKSQEAVNIKKIGHNSAIRTGHMTSFNNSRNKEMEEAALKTLNNDSVMVGAVTAALGASALLVQQQSQDQCNSEGSRGSASKSTKEKGIYQKASGNLEEMESERNHNIVTSLAEKAMSVAGPVVPTKEDGEVDQERLVAMLADLGQKGGMLKLVGKIALLWGGIRGAMSLTDRLIMFLHIAERPLYQRILGFAGMVLVLWSPVTVPLLPTLVQSWTTGRSSGFAEFVCIVGLYTAIMILVVLWGRRIRGYEDPLEQYGLDLTALPKIQSFLRALVGGFMLVAPIQSLNALLGCVNFSWPSSLPSSSLDAMARLKVHAQMVMLAGRGIVTATCIVLVEELLFRSWLLEEIAADLGFHRGIIISGLAFSLSQRSLWEIPGLWLFSLALSGLRQRSQGSLCLPVGLRTGIMASNFVLQTGGFLTYKSNYPVWVTGTHPQQPFSGVIGLAFSLLLAIIFYPRQLLQKMDSEMIKQG